MGPLLPARGLTNLVIAGKKVKDGNKSEKEREMLRLVGGIAIYIESSAGGVFTCVRLRMQNKCSAAVQVDTRENEVAPLMNSLDSICTNVRACLLILNEIFA
jgi:hypothetical protein